MDQITAPQSSLKRLRKTVAFSGAAGNGAVGTVVLGTITGRVFVDRLAIFCTEDLVGAGATVSCGVVGAATLFLDAITATDLDNGEWWQDASVQAAGVHMANPTSGDQANSTRSAAIGANIIFTIGTANITDGTVIVDIWYDPITDDGLLV